MVSDASSKTSSAYSNFKKYPYLYNLSFFQYTYVMRQLCFCRIKIQNTINGLPKYEQNWEIELLVMQYTSNDCKCQRKIEWQVKYKCSGYNLFYGVKKSSLYFEFNWRLAWLSSLVFVMLTVLEWNLLKQT